MFLDWFKKGKNKGKVEKPEDLEQKARKNSTTTIKRHQVILEAVENYEALPLPDKRKEDIIEDYFRGAKKEGFFTGELKALENKYHESRIQKYKSVGREIKQ